MLRGSPLIQFSEISLTRPTDLSSLISEPANRPGFVWQRYGIYFFRDKVLLGLSKRWGLVVPAWVSVILLVARLLRFLKRRLASLRKN